MIHTSLLVFVLVALDISLKTLVSDSPKEGRDDRYHVPEYPLIQCLPTWSPPKFLRSHSRSAHVRDSLWEPLNCVLCMANRRLQA